MQARQWGSHRIKRHKLEVRGVVRVRRTPPRKLSLRVGLAAVFKRRHHKGHLDVRARGRCNHAWNSQQKTVAGDLCKENEIRTVRFKRHRTATAAGIERRQPRHVHRHARGGVVDGVGAGVVLQRDVDRQLARVVQQTARFVHLQEPIFLRQRVEDEEDVNAVHEVVVVGIHLA